MQEIKVKWRDLGYMVAAFICYTIVSSNEGGQENETLEMDEATQKTETK